MTGKRNYFLPSSKLFREQESAPRTTFLNAQALRKAEARLEGYVASRRKEVVRESDIAWHSDNWMA